MNRFHIELRPAAHCVHVAVIGPAGFVYSSARLSVFEAAAQGFRVARAYSRAKVFRVVVL